MNQKQNATKNSTEGPRADQNWENIDRSIRIGNAGLQVFQTVRDLSVTTLLLGATALSGGVAAAALGAGATLHGTATYQNGGTVGDALLAASADVVVGAFGIGLARSAQQAEVATSANAAVDSRSVLLWLVKIGPPPPVMTHFLQSELTTPRFQEKTASAVTQNRP